MNRWWWLVIILGVAILALGGILIFAHPAHAPVPTPGENLDQDIYIAILNPDGSLPNDAKPGDTSGCDHVVLQKLTVPKSSTPLSDALQSLLENKSVWSDDNKLYNYLGQGNLKLASVTIANGLAKIYLVGTPPPLAGVCDDPRLLIQVTETARQFPTVQKVQVFVNGVENTGSGNEKGQ